jgi:Ca2+-binding EF-hand superfamily protein
MFFALGAASSAIDALKALTSSKSSSAPTTGVSQNSTSPFDLMSSGSSTSVGSGSGSGSGSGGGGSQISPQTMSALLDAQSQSSAGSTTAAKSRSAALKDLFGQIDGDGDGKISKEEFETALGAGGTNLKQADSVFGKLDKDGDGSVSLKELASALKGGKHHHDQRAENSSGDDGSNSDPFAQALQGASTTSVTNSDGSVTTSLTYADGSKVTMTSAAGKSSSTSAASSYNFIEQMIQRQAQAISSAATSSLSVSV